MNMTRYSKIMILLGALLLLIGLMLTFEPLYTWAQDSNHPCRVALDPDDNLFELENMNPGDSTTRTVTVVKTGESSANLYMTWDPISEIAGLGGGQLLEVLQLEIWETDEEGNRIRLIYSGLMADAPPFADDLTENEIEARWIAFMEHNDVLYLEFIVTLPGPQTSNDYQNASHAANLVFYTICADIPPPPPPPPPPFDYPAINIEKLTNGFDADNPTGPQVEVGGDVTWTYIVTNFGDVPLSNIAVTDNIAGVNPVYVSGDTNNDGIMQVGEVWIFQASGVAIEGQYANIGTAVGTPPSGPNVTDRDPSHYFGVLTPVEEEFPPEGPEVTPDPEDDDSVVIVRPEPPLTDLPLPRTDGTSLSLLIVGLLLLMAGISLRKSERYGRQAA